MLAKLSLVVALLAAPPTAFAQHHATEARTHREGMPTAGVLGIPHSRHGSGTAWLPDGSPARAIHRMIGGWMVMLHGNVVVGYIAQGSDVGESELTSQNWIMAMASHALGGGTFTARGMFSLEPLTIGDDGYPLLLQTGEGLVDAQHPHDLFMEVAARYEHALGDGVAFETYAALAGEPAFGPVAFPHRPSGLPDPMAPLGHHWLDSTHISFGVLTAGLFTRDAKLEGSWFNGREPDDRRYDLDLRTPDSLAARLTVNPSRAWSVQASHAYLATPEATEPDTSVQRTTASVTHVVAFGRGRSVASTIAVGRDDPSRGPVTHAALAETALDLARWGTTFARAEYVGKTEHDFELPMEDAILPVGALSLGHAHTIARAGELETALGVRGSVGIVDDVLEARYGTRAPLGVMAFVQVVPRIAQ